MDGFASRVGNSSKILTPNERARRKKKKEIKIVKNGEMRENQKEEKMAPFLGLKLCFCAKMRKNMTKRSF